MQLRTNKPLFLRVRHAILAVTRREQPIRATPEPKGDQLPVVSFRLDPAWRKSVCGPLPQKEARLEIPAVGEIRTEASELGHYRYGANVHLADMRLPKPETCRPSPRSS